MAIEWDCRGKYIKQSRAMLRHLDDLDRRQIASLDGNVGRHRHLRQTEGTRVGIVARASDLKREDDGMAHILWNFTEAEIDVDKCGPMAREPARLNCKGAAVYGPFGAVGGGGHAAALKEGLVRVDGTDGKLLTWIDPFHAVGVVEGATRGIVGHPEAVCFGNCAVGQEVVSSVAGVCDDGVGMGEACTE